MEIKLKEEPQNVTIIQGFPGFGMVGSISTEFLLEHLKTREIGTVSIKDVSPLLAIHNGKIIPPIGIHYNEEYNIVIINFLTKGKDKEWKFADIVKELAKRFNATEVIGIEGVTAQTAKDSNKIYTFSSSEEKMKKLEADGFNKLNEGIIMGVSAALILSDNSFPITNFFSLTASTLPDSNAAAEIIKALDKYLGLKVEFEPLLEQAKQFEGKIKSLLSKSQQAIDDKENSMLNYVG